MPLFGSPDISKMKAKGDVQGLIKVLLNQKNKKDSELIDITAVNAVRALGDIKDPRAVEPLIAALKYPYRYVRWGAAHALGEIGDARAVEPLIAALKEDNNGDAIEALGKLMDARAVEPLVFVLGNQIGNKISAAKVLEKFGWKPGLDETGAIYWLESKHPGWDKCVEIGAPAVEPLIAKLKHKDPNVRNHAAEALGKIADARATEPLIAILKDGDDNVVAAAAVALGKIGDARAVEPLIDAFNTRHIGLGFYYKVADALAEIGDARAVEPLLAALKDEQKRFAAALTVGSFKDARAVEPLIAALKDSDESVCGAAASSLGKIGDARAVEPLIAALKEDHNFQKSPLGYSHEVQEDILREKCCNALGKLGDTRAIEPLTTILNTGYKEMRGVAARALLDIGAPDSLHDLIERNKGFPLPFHPPSREDRGTG